MLVLKCFSLVLFFDMCLSNTETYRAGILEYSATNNLNIHLKFIQEASKENLDILILPSSGRRILDSTLIAPDTPGDGAPCHIRKFDEVVRTMSCAARDSSMYVVINVDEKMRCDDYAYRYFSTDLVFDRDGHIASIFRRPLHQGLGCNNTEYSLTTFTTNFGVKFAHVRNEDLVTRNPNFYIEKGVKNFLLTSTGNMDTAFIDADQYFLSWTHAAGANLLVSINSEELDHKTNIYSSNVKVDLTSGDKTRKLHITELKKNPSFGSQASSIHYNHMNSRNVKDLDLSDFNTKILDLESSKSGYTGRVCDGRFCCEFHVKTSNIDVPKDVATYRMAVFGGVKRVARNNLGLQVCFLAACSGRDVAKCGTGSQASQTKINFELMRIKGDFARENSAQLPVLLTDAILPQTSNVTFETDKSTRQVTITLNEKQNTVLAFGIYGRDFSKDEIAENYNYDSMNNDNSTDGAIDNEDELIDKEDVDDLFDYLWIRLRILIFVVSIYVLEMM